MIHDVWTVARKEWLEIIEQLLRFKRGGWSVLVIIFFLGVLSPLQMGLTWLTSPLMFFYWPLLTSSMTSTLVADAVAGERERHTLETLLASRLSDTAILLGKILAAVMYGYAFALTNLLIGWTVVNVRHHDGALLGFAPARLAALLALIGAGAFFISGIGVFVSLRATTVRQAQQTFGIIMLVLLMLPAALYQVTSAELQQRVLGRVSELGVDGVSALATAILGVLAVILNAAAIRRFKRGKLALE